MPRVIVLHWQPGGAGDLVQSLLLSQPEKNQGIVGGFTTESTGRVKPHILPVFNDNFTPNSQGWYTRIWTEADCDLLKNLIAPVDSEYFIIPTHIFDQVDFLKSQFADAKSAGITYPENLYPLVLKNFCKKIALNDEPTLLEIYNDKHHQYLRSKNVFSEYVMLEQLRHGSTLKKSFNDVFDINISLENLYNNDLSDLHELINDSEHTKLLLQAWLDNQDVIQKHRYPISLDLEVALGFNTKIPQLTDLTNVKLDSFDNILIKHHFKSKFDYIPSFTTLEQADQFIQEKAPT